MNAIPAPDPKSLLLLAKGVTKAFGRTQALAGADFALKEREIHGLFGASGAGKSTLCSVIAGQSVFDAGEITYRSYPIKLRSARDGMRVGIAVVMQDARLVPDLTVLENIFLPELGRRGRLDYGALRKRGADLLESLGQAGALSLDGDVRQLSCAQRQLVEIVKALGARAKLMIFDEPTACLSPAEIDRLFDMMTRLRLAGRGLVFVSHRPEDMIDIADRVTVMRDGRTVLNAQPAASLTKAAMIQAAAGHAPPIRPEPSAGTASRAEEIPVLEVRNLAAAPVVHDVSFAVRRGEIVGLAGVVGAGRSEAVEAIFGLRARTGLVQLDGVALPAHRPKAAIRSGLGFVAQDRAQSIVPDLSIKDNLLLAHLGARRSFGFARGDRDKKAEDLMRRLGLPLAHRSDTPILSCPAGLQQMISIGRWLMLDPKVLIVDEPTHDVDSETHAAIQALLREVAASGVAVIVVSSDWDELLALSDRVVVLSEGRSIADLPSTVLDTESLSLLAAPRSATLRNTALLADLTGENGGVGFWALIKDERVICLNTVVADEAADPGFRAGQSLRLSETRIPEALRKREPIFVAEHDATRATMLIPLRSRRDQDAGWIGLSLPNDGRLPPPAAVKFRIDMLKGML